MQLDDEVCLCFHVTKRKVLNYLRIERPRRAGQLSECFGAGTGCGWCRGLLERYFTAAQAGRIENQPDTPGRADEPSPEDHALARAQYIRAGKGTPPMGGQPLPDLGP